MEHAGKRLLIVEDEALIAWDLTEALSAAGYQIVGPAMSVASALALLDSPGCDLAVIDVNLGAESSAAVARELRRRSIPHIAVSGYDGNHLPAEFDGVPRLRKPVDIERLVEEIRLLIKT